jgi:hypothetical protein
MIKIRATYFLLFFLIKSNCDAQTTLFQKEYGTTVNDGIADLIQLPSGNYVLCGSSGLIGYWPDLRLLCTDSLGTILWSGDYTIPNYIGFGFINRIINTYDSQIIFAGSLRSAVQY